MSYVFKSIPNKQLDSLNVDNYNQSIFTTKQIEFLKMCSINPNCALVSYNRTECKFYSDFKTQNFVPSSVSIYYKKQNEKSKTSAFTQISYSYSDTTQSKTTIFNPGANTFLIQVLLVLVQLTALKPIALAQIVHKKY